MTENFNQAVDQLSILIRDRIGTNYRYTLKSTGQSSTRFGNCEVCHLPASEVYHQTEEREYKTNHWTPVLDLYGHKECLEKIRKLSVPEIERRVNNIIG